MRLDVRFLPERGQMIRYAPFLVGAAAGVLYYRERRERLALERLGAATLESLLDAIDANNAETGAHVRRVADYALLLAVAADADERMQRSVERVALFHDIGKIDGAISDIVGETKKLTPEEKRSVMQHTRRGAQVLRPLAAFYPDLPEGVLSHHERWDGTGYPRGLRGEAIPIEARIVAIADTFDAITHTRSYSHARSLKAAVEIIAAGRGTQFDPDLVDLFLSPPVLDHVDESMRRANSPRRAHGKRRGRSAQTSVPDITFRWRSPSPLLQRAGR
jgi:HD-GYP domain-containing protein (c-di-GMP phosphodiesterase class II)